jgi:DNA invertase Pin-like site-specific DNA recombinase
LGLLLLAPAPANPTEIRIGYARGVHRRAELERQLDALRAVGCRRIFAEKQSGRDTDRPKLTACLAFLAPGDTLVVPSLDRLSRSLADLITTVGELRRRDIGVTSLHENLDTTTPGGRLIFHVFAALAEFIPDLRELRAAGRARIQLPAAPAATS